MAVISSYSYHEELERNYDQAKPPSPFLYPSISGKNRIALFPMHPPYGMRFASVVWHIGEILFLSPSDFLFTMRFLIEAAIFRKRSTSKLAIVSIIEQLVKCTIGHRSGFRIMRKSALWSRRQRLGKCSAHLPAWKGGLHNLRKVPALRLERTHRSPSFISI